MKSTRFVFSLFASSLALWMAGCSTSSTKSSSALYNSTLDVPPFVPPSAVDSSRNIDLASGRALVVKLESDPAIGYTWAANTLGNGVLTQVGQPTYISDPAAVARSTGGVETWVFRATQPGRDELRFESRQRSALSSNATGGVTFHVNVR